MVAFLLSMVLFIGVCGFSGYPAAVANQADPGTEVITGHYALAAGAKSVDHRAPLWSLMLATQWLDVVFIPLFLLGVETIETLPGGGYGKVVIHADYTHSLIGALVLVGRIRRARLVALGSAARSAARRCRVFALGARSHRAPRRHADSAGQRR